MYRIASDDTCSKDNQSETHSSDDMIYDEPTSTDLIAQYFEDGKVCDSAGNWYTEEMYVNKITPRHHSITDEIESLIPNDEIGVPIEDDVLISNVALAEINVPNPNIAPTDEINASIAINAPIANIAPVDIGPYECPILGCSTTLKLKYNVKRHVEQFHGELRLDTGTYGIKKYVCAQCKRRCLSKNNVNQHFQQQHGQNPRFEIDWDDVEPLKYK